MVNGVRPRHFPFNVTLAPLGTDRTTSVPVVTAGLDGGFAAAGAAAAGEVRSPAPPAPRAVPAAAGAFAPDAAGGATACSLYSRPAGA
jgi:hypothetical protein